MRRRQTTLSPKRQRGATLVIALIFLIILTMLGTTVASNNTLQERMASNTRNRDLAFQEAEAALRFADTQINTYRQHFIGGGTLPTGLYNNGENHENDAAYWSDFNWIDDAATPTTQVGSERFIVERMGKDEAFRITARGVGPSNAIVILQSMYKY
jgi:type IV pilus assembly protein PilX